MRKIEENSLAWYEARVSYGKSDISVRQLAKKLGVSEKTVRNRIKSEKWLRNSVPSAPPPQPSPQPIPLGEAAARVAKAVAVAEWEQDRPPRVSATPAPEPIHQGVEPEQRGEPRTATEISRDFCGTIDVLRAELDTVIRNLHLIREIAEANLDDSGEKARERRRIMINKVLELPGLLKASNDLTAALSRLTEADPGKKEQLKSTAKQIGSTGRFATPSAPSVQTAH